MANIGEFIVGYPSAAGGGTGGDGTSTEVIVPGNADAIVARSMGMLVTVEKIDANHVTVGYPGGASLSQIRTIANQLSYLFGAPAVDEIGWLTVTAKGLLGYADGADEDSAPDYTPVVGQVVFTPELPGTIKLVTTNRFFAVAGVTATFDSDGELSYAGQKNIRLIAPQWSELSNKTWRWIASVQPGPGQSWTPFTVFFTGAPGAVINLATLL